MLANVVRHSRATTATVSLRVANSAYHLDIRDNGVGMIEELAADRLADGDIGIASHRARVEAAHGSLTILPVSAGTHVSVVVPLRG